MVADALVYHPTVAHYLRFVATTVGRDKLLRTLQYFARFYSWYLFRTNALTTSIAPWESLKKSFSVIRRGMRVGKNVEHFKAAAVAADAKGMDPVLKYCAVGRQLGYAMYLSLDVGVFLDQTGIRPMASAKRLQKEAYRAWMTGLIFNAVAGFYSLWRLGQREEKINKKEGEGVVEGKKLERERNAARMQLTSDLCDLVIPLSAIGFVNFDEGIVGLAGTTSSLIGLLAQWRKTA
ncbi:Peroxisomal membrane protein PMP27 [Thelotrema lepadinum]|nr:Peroxisomal membrane protein PMP27 [Thelotrema lepadinum]